MSKNRKNRFWVRTLILGCAICLPWQLKAATSSQYASGWSVNNDADWTPFPPSTNPLSAPDVSCTDASTPTGSWAEFTFSGFSIPGGDVINGVEVQFKYRSSASNTAQLTDGGSLVGNTRTVPLMFDGPSYCSSTANVTSGSPTDLWNVAGLTAADFNGGNIGVRLTQDGNTIGLDSIQLVVHHSDGANTAPTADAGGPYSVNEGGSVAVSGSASSDTEQATNTLTFAWDMDNNGTYETAGISPNFSAAGRDGPDSQTIGLQVTDSGGLSRTNTATVNINNVAPTINSINLSSPSINEGQSVAVSGTFSDPGTGETHTGSALWSDAVSSSVTIGAGTFTTGRTFSDDDPTGTPSDTYTVAITISDGDSGSDTQTSPDLTVNNVAPTANDDGSTGFITDEDSSFTTTDVRTNDTDPGTDTLQVSGINTTGTIGLVQNNGNGTFDYDPNGMFEHLGTGDTASDSFTYTVVDDDTGLSGSATVTITINGVNDAPVITSVSPASQTVDYSDHISQVTISATDVDSENLTLSHSPVSLPSNLSTSGGCSPAGVGGSSCSWTMNGQVLVPGDNIHTIDFTVSDTEASNDCSGDVTVCRHVLTVEPEDVLAWLDTDNPVSSGVLVEGGDQVDFSLTFYATELESPESAPNAFGDMNNAEGFMTLTPVGPGSPINVSCSRAVNGSGYAQEAEFTCAFTAVPPNAYEVSAWVDGLSDTTIYYYGETDESVFVVFDASLGFTTGGGWFYWPGSADPQLSSCGEGGYAGDKTNFGFNMKYNKKHKNVQGNLLLMRHVVDSECLDAGRYKVKSSRLDGMGLGDADDGNPYGWATFSGKAGFREPGLDNEGNHSFLAYVEDHNDQGCNQDPSDEFWIEVKDKDGIVVLEINGPNSDPAGDDETDGDDEPIECGNIIVPQNPGDKSKGKGKGKP